MSVRSVRFSLVVSTLNRSAELKPLMESLLNQEFEDFEVIVVDQNFDDRIVPVLESYQSQLNIRRVPTPARQGISAARNDGWRRARGDVILFPDDDCWYPPWFLRKGHELLEKTGAKLVSGRIADEAGRSINGRFASSAQFITRRSVWLTHSEAATFHRRELLERLNGFDEKLGVGSSTRWQAAEGADLILNALECRCVCYFDPSLYGFHREFDLDDPALGMARKGRAYGRGMGFVLRRHRFGVSSILYWATRPLITALVSAISGRFHRMGYALSVSLGRIEGWTMSRNDNEMSA
jgi:glycosyltransferase involved in cell wall biosynthesis